MRRTLNKSEERIMPAKKLSSSHGSVLTPLIVVAGVAFSIWLAKRSGSSPYKRHGKVTPAMVGNWVPSLSVAGEEDPGAAAEILRDYSEK